MAKTFRFPGAMLAIVSKGGPIDCRLAWMFLALSTSLRGSW